MTIFSYRGYRMENFSVQDHCHCTGKYREPMFIAKWQKKLPFNVGNSGGENWDVMCEARWDGKNNGGVFLVVELPSRIGRNPTELQKKNSNS